VEEHHNSIQLHGSVRVRYLMLGKQCWTTQTIPSETFMMMKLINA